MFELLKLIQRVTLKIDRICSKYVVRDCQNLCFDLLSCLANTLTQAPSFDNDTTLSDKGSCLKSWNCYKELLIKLKGLVQNMWCGTVRTFVLTYYPASPILWNRLLPVDTSTTLQSYKNSYNSPVRNSSNQTTSDTKEKNTDHFPLGSKKSI